MRPGQKHTAEAKIKMSMAKLKNPVRVTGIKKSAEEREQISRRLVGNKYRLGKNHTEEVRAKISETHLGSKRSAFIKERIAKARKGSKHTLETRLKLCGPKRKLISVNGIPFKTLTEAAKYFNLEYHAIYYRIEKGIFKAEYE